MKRLLILTNYKQEAAIKELMISHGIEVSESESSFLDQTSLWVKDEDYPKARELVEARVALDGIEAHRKFTDERKEQWGGSNWRWFFAAIKKKPLLLIFKIILLITLLWIFLLVPIWTIFRGSG
ncbi:MAG: hypothetical protein ACKVQA_19540 [Burkholderiales bacterium]